MLFSIRKEATFFSLTVQKRLSKFRLWSIVTPSSLNSLTTNTSTLFSDTVNNNKKPDEQQLIQQISRLIDEKVLCMTPGTPTSTTPAPFLPDDPDYIIDYNELLRKFQTEITALITKHMASRIESATTQLIELKSLLANNRDLNNYFQAIEKEVQSELSDNILARNNKASKIIKEDKQYEYRQKQRSPRSADQPGTSHNIEERSPDYSPPNYFYSNNRPHNSYHNGRLNNNNYNNNNNDTVNPW